MTTIEAWHPLVPKGYKRGGMDDLGAAHATSRYGICDIDTELLDKMCEAGQIMMVDEQPSLRGPWTADGCDWFGFRRSELKHTDGYWISQESYRLAGDNTIGYELCVKMAHQADPRSPVEWTIGSLHPYGQTIADDAERVREIRARRGPLSTADEVRHRLNEGVPRPGGFQEIEDDLVSRPISRRSFSYTGSPVSQSISIAYRPKRATYPLSRPERDMLDESPDLTRGVDGFQNKVEGRWYPERRRRDDNRFGLEDQVTSGSHSGFQPEHDNSKRTTSPSQYGSERGHAMSNLGQNSGFSRTDSRPSGGTPYSYAAPVRVVRTRVSSPNRRT